MRARIGSVLPEALRRRLKPGIQPGTRVRIGPGVRGTLCLAGWLAVGFLPISAQVVINEIHYAPDVKTEHVEFIELHNPGTNAVDVSGWAFTDGVQFVFPAQTLVTAGGYLVVAAEPAALRAKFGVAALGPWQGRLSKRADRLVLRDAAAQMRDEVAYQLGFPWPTVGDPPGNSIELLNPSLDNSLAGSWRSSFSGNPAQQSQVLIPDHSEWKYLKGTAEASSPTTAWREGSFDDSAWPAGKAPVGYDPQVVMGTPLDDMRSNYISFFLRRTFVVDDPATVNSLTLEALYDDGFKLWINGTNVLNVALPAGEVPFTNTAEGTARESNAYDTFAINNAAAFLRPGTNLIAVQVHNVLLAGSSDCFFDARLTAQAGASGRGPTPGRVNSVYATNVPPQVHQADHHPNQPTAGQPVRIIAHVTHPKGVKSVSLHYQLVDPGNYIELTDPAYATDWTTVPMNDAGLDGDEIPADNRYTVTLPGELQVHRRLVRYRITGVEAGGNSVTVPYADDPQPNFAYFVYAGVPAWTGAVRPGAAGAPGQVFTVSSNEMNRLPVYHLLAKRQSVEDSTWFSHYWGDAYPWLGTLVYDGEVYDHVRYRARGGVWRYSMCKNMWKFDLNRGHDFQARDDWGRKYNTKWTKLNLGASIQQGDYNHRGEQGMFESVGFRLFNLAGVETCHTTFVQFRVIDAAQEIDPTTQYEGDFWGVYLAVEQEDGRFLDEHGLPDANFYKMEGGTGTLNNLGPNGPTDKSDLNRFLAGLNSSSTDAWWRTNWHLPNGYSYQTIVQAIHHFDIAAGKNYFYYRNPETGLWTIHTWDLDLTWAENMYDAGGYGGEVFKTYALPRPALNLEYRNRVREVRDLLFNADQTGQLIDEYAGRLRGPADAPSILDADRSQWDYNPKMIDGRYTENPSSKAGQGRFYRWPNEPNVSRDFNGCLQLMKNYVEFRSTNSGARGGPLDKLAADSLIPDTPTATYTGPTNYAVNQLTFRTSAFSGPGQFASLRWRIGEITRPSGPSWTFAEPWKYEIEPVWESGELANFALEITVPTGVLKVGHVYRARVQMKDQTGRTSHWSPPVEFVAGAPDNEAALQQSLRISELMYNPPGGSEFEFIELHNAGSVLPLDLSGVKFTAGVDFTFPPGTSLAPGNYLLVAKAATNDNFAAFRAHYRLDSSVAIAGPYSGTLANEGEELTLKSAAGGATIVAFDYKHGRGWPVAADGAGHSLVPLERASAGQGTGALDYGGNWRASTFLGGSPGQADPAPPPSLRLNEILAHTDYANPLLPEYDSNDWIELYNPTDAAVTLGGWYLSDDAEKLGKWAIPAVAIAAHGWVAFDEVTGFHHPLTNGFGLNKAGERVLLSYLPGGAQDRVVDAVSFGGQARDISWGRYPDGGTQWRPLAPTRGEANRLALLTPVISELMYHPSDSGTNQADNAEGEFVELLNPTTTTANLFDTNGLWRIDGTVTFLFPTNTFLSAGGRLLVVSFSPTNTAALELFRTRYGLTNSTVPILGPYEGNLANSSGRVAVERPQAPDLPGEPYSWVVVDELIYGDQLPWPVEADGQGMSLQRRAAGGAGNDPDNWTARLPTPGSDSSESPPGDADGDGLPDAWERVHNLNPLVAAGDDGAGGDPDGDGLTNLAEYLAGTDPRLATLRFTSFTVVAGEVRLGFHLPANRALAVQYRDSVDGGEWLPLRTFSAEPAPRLVEVTHSDLAGVRHRFYRLAMLR